MDTLSYKTKSARAQDIQRKWYVVDATNQPLGRISSEIASILRGKHRPNFTPHVDCGDYVIVINAGKVRLTGKKLDQSVHQRYSGYPGGRRTKTLRQVQEAHPERLIEHAIRGMIPGNRLGRQVFKKLFVYAGSDHPHKAQKPENLKFD